MAWAHLSELGATGTKDQQAEWDRCPPSGDVVYIQQLWFLVWFGFAILLTFFQDFLLKSIRLNHIRLLIIDF